MYAILYRAFALAMVLLSSLTLVAQSLPESSTQPSATVDPIDQYINSLVLDKEVTVAELAQQLTRTAQNDRQKARVIYRWVTSNITYDWPAYESRNISDQRPEIVLKKRTAICAGYARLYRALCEAAKVKCEVISGYAKAQDYQLGQPIDEPNHAWNAVHIDNKWHLVDVTWGAGGRNRQASDYYFLTPPQQMIYSHLPEDDRWQLLSKKVSIYEFERLFLVFPYFFDYPLSNFNYGQSLISTNKTSLIVSFTAPREYIFSPSLEDNGEMIDLLRHVRRRGDEVLIRLDDLQPDHIYKLHVFGATSDTIRTLNLVMTYFISTGKNKMKYYADVNTEFKLDPFTRMPYWFMAQYQEYLEAEDYRSMENFIRENLVRYPDNKWLYLKLGYVYEKQNRPTAAVEPYRKAIAIDPEYFEAHYSLGILYYNEAVNVYEKLRQMSRQEYQQKGRDYLSRVAGYFSKAKPYFQKALVLNKTNDDQIKTALVNIDKFVK